MGSVKRKSLDEPTGDPSPPQKLLRDKAPLVTGEPVACVHDVSYPDNYVPPPPPVPKHSTPAKEFPFTLDPFQSEAIKCLDNGESVMVFILFNFFFLFWL